MRVIKDKITSIFYLMDPPNINKHFSYRNLSRVLFGSAWRLDTLHGIFVVSLFSLASYHISSFEIMKNLSISPVIIGLMLGALYANSLGKDLPAEWMPGIFFCKKNVLNIAIIFYGVQLTFQDLSQVGLGGFLACIFIVSSTFFVAFFLGKYFFKLDSELSLLIAAGSSICGSAAVLSTGLTLKSNSCKNTIAVAITFLFGTAGMFLFPLVYRLGLFPISEDTFGIFLGATLHSVGNVAAAGAAISAVTEKNAIIIKMMRVMMLVPFLLILGLFTSKEHTASEPRNRIKSQQKSKVIIPWFAIFFVVTIAINSWLQPSLKVISLINHFDKFCLTMAMAALGIETNSSKMQGVGLKPIYLGFTVSIWLIIVGLLISHFIG